MEPHPRLLVYKASAGSGKTFTLAVQYIRLLITDPSAYQRILAVTFTNKATAEMKERILSQLYGIATDNPDSSGYLAEIMKETSFSREEICRRADEALHRIIHDYSRFRIETIDSFFQSVMRNLARELEIGTNLSVELNDVEVLSDAVDSLIEKLAPGSPVLSWLLEYIDERIADDRRWNVSNEIKSFGKNILDETYVERGTELRRKLDDAHFIPTYRREVQEMRNEALEQMKGFDEQFQGVLEMNGVTTNDIKNGAHIANYFKKLSNGILDSGVRNATVEKCLSSEENWVKKTSAHREEILALAGRELMPLLGEAEKFRAVNNLLVNSCNLSLRYLNNLRLLTHIDLELRLQNRLHNRFLLSDTSALLHSLIREGDTPFVYEKIGATIDTVMIDEFQDTSRLQWENFRLLLEESLAQREGSLIVGDIKQSIYRWRNGDWKILAGLNHDKAFRIDEKTLEKNWRSETNVIRFNNALFTAACNVLGKRHEEELGKPCEQLQAAYSDVCQQTAKKTEEGYVKINFLTDNKEVSYAEQTLKQLAEEVGYLHSQGINSNEIVILVRKKKAIPAIADYFDKNTPYRIVSDEAFRLDASLAVCLMIEAIRYLTMPADCIARAKLALSFQQEVLGKNIDLNTILLSDITGFLPAGFVLQQEELRLMPLFELLERLFLIFDLSRVKNQDAYLCAFHDAVTEYVQNNSSELTSFIEYWDEKMHERTIPSGELEGIRILSIHKSKGLEFHTVLVPFCDWKMENETNSHLIWCSVAGTGETTDIAPFNRLDLVPVNYSAAMKESIYQNSYLEERLQLWVDNLNLLYVAFTRACKNLIVWAHDGQKNSISALLSDALQTATDIELRTSDETSEERTYEYGSLCIRKDKAKAQSSNRLLASPETINLHIESLESEIEFKQSNRSADFIRGDEEKNTRREYIQQGQLLHYVFASIEKADDLERALEQLRFEGVLEEDREAQVRKLAAWAMNHPKVKEWYDGSWNLYNECAIVYRDENGVMQTRRPDRVMMKGKNVIVVDFKFGKQQEEHIRQVSEYMELIRRMGYTHVQGYLWYVFSNELVLI